MTATDPLTAAIREKIARIIDPFAFDDSKWEAKGEGIRADLKASALAKADRIIAIDLGFEDLPRELQLLVGDLEADLSGADLLARSAAAAFPEVESTNGREGYTAIVMPKEDGSLAVAVLVDQDGTPEDDGLEWLCGTFSCPEAQRMAAQLEVSAAGGGNA